VTEARRSPRLVLAASGCWSAAQRVVAEAEEHLVQAADRSPELLRRRAREDRPLSEGVEKGGGMLGGRMEQVAVRHLPSLERPPPLDL
jgi:hypothetical protein